MLRITVNKNRQTLTYQLEGKLTAPWLEELEKSWKSIMADERTAILRVDLIGVTFIDDAGKACLASIYRDGAEFITADCASQAVVDEITMSAAQVARATSRRPQRRT
jgi:ABC-type transporter Mla MlaB component